MERILVVEDDLALNAGLCFELDTAGYASTSAYNCAKARYLVRQEHFSLVLLDVNLPDGSGFELCREIKELHPELPVIFLTANDLEEDVLSGFDMGAEDYVTKPFNMKILLRRIEVALRRGKDKFDYYHVSEEEGGPTRREMLEGQPYWVAGLDRLTDTGNYTSVIVSLEGDYLDYILENTYFTSGSFDAEAFASGHFVLTAGASAKGLSSEGAGETVTLEGETFEVLGSISNDGIMLSGSNSAEASFCIYYYMTPDAFDRLFPDQGVRQAAVRIDKNKQKTFEAYLDEYEQGLNRGVSITRRSEYQENFAVARLNTVLPTLIVSLVLLGIALLNFINLLIIKVISRKKEFAVYESLGMTHAQLRKLLVLEGVFHAAMLSLAAGPFVFLFARFAMPSVIEGIGSWCMVYTFSVTPLALTLPVILALSVSIPLGCLHVITRGSITRRLGTVE